MRCRIPVVNTRHARDDAAARPRLVRTYLASLFRCRSYHLLLVALDAPLTLTLLHAWPRHAGPETLHPTSMSRLGAPLHRRHRHFALALRLRPHPAIQHRVAHFADRRFLHTPQDHLDVHTLNQLIAQQAADPHGRRLRFFLPLGIKKWAIQNLGGVRDEDVVELDWWEGVELSRGDTSPGPANERLKIQCTPSQHFVSRFTR